MIAVQDPTNADLPYRFGGAGVIEQRHQMGFHAREFGQRGPDLIEAVLENAHHVLTGNVTAISDGQNSADLAQR
ncbi:MAG: hypothetical protein JWR34_404 [Mycobacterium sp.]|nr:hypothetical protein [Mycobacterium sp.]